MRGMKTGGRVRGTPNRATVEKRLEIARQLDDARNHGRPLAIARQFAVSQYDVRKALATEGKKSRR